MTTEPLGELVQPLPPEPFAATVGVQAVMRVSIDREPVRRRCYQCDRRRELYRVRIENIWATDETDARCAECWGLR